MGWKVQDYLPGAYLNAAAVGLPWCTHRIGYFGKSELHCCKHIFPGNFSLAWCDLSNIATIWLAKLIRSIKAAQLGGSTSTRRDSRSILAAAAVPDTAWFPRETLLQQLWYAAHFFRMLLVGIWLLRRDYIASANLLDDVCLAHLHFTVEFI